MKTSAFGLTLGLSCLSLLTALSTRAHAQSNEEPSPQPSRADENGAELADRALAESELPDRALAESDLPVPFAQRPLTMPRLNVSGTFDIQVIRSDFPFRRATTGVELGLRGSFSPAENLELGTSIVGLQLTPEIGTVGTPAFFARYRFLSGDVEVAAEISTDFGSFDPLLVRVTPGIPVLFHLGDSASLRTGVHLPLLLGDGIGLFFGSPTPQRESAAALVGGRTPTPGLSIPIDVSVNFTPNVFARVRTGLAIANLEEADESLLSPFFAGAGATFASESGPLIDIHAEFGFPSFIDWTVDDKILTEFWQLNLGATLYFDPT